MIIRRATAADAPLIAQWRKETARWLAEQGSDQWSEAGLDEHAFQARVVSSIHHGETWIAERDGEPVGTAAIDQWADPELWTKDQLNESLVLHRMIVPRKYAGQRIGAALIDHANRLALEADLKWIRLDAWTSNEALHDYYLRQGFRRVRETPAMVSGTLFERSTRDQVLTEPQALAHAVEYLTTPPDERDPMNGPMPDFVYLLDAFAVIPKIPESETEGSRQLKDGEPYRPILVPGQQETLQYVDGEWLIEHPWGHKYAPRVASWPTGLILDPDLVYVLQEISGDIWISPAEAPT